MELRLSYGEQLMKKYLDIYLGGFKFIDNWKPSWLKASTGHYFELDRYYPELEVGFEFQGEQHFQNESQVYRDKHKWNRCKHHNIEVILIDTSDLCSGSMEHRAIRATHSFRMNLPPNKRKAIRDIGGKAELKELDKEAKQYRKLIRSNFPDSKSAYPQGHVKRSNIKVSPGRYQGEHHSKPKKYAPLSMP